MKIVKLNPNEIKCGVCGKYFDPASLKQVIKHEHSENESMFQAILAGNLKKDIEDKKK